uniref:U-box domain-containing protein 4-like n=1 Tax=Erigeron canadensis TaxID=72917 RepID=UPI001CB96C11|nr:U-box domain-containing protein 4-like [Erigeron canadensis]XP_043631657.1 U-box domain-containing protein 4-like [Erigeron canadensis]
MEISLLKQLLKNIYTFLHRDDNKYNDIVEKYYVKVQEVLKLVKPVLESIVDSEAASNELLREEFAGMSQCVDEIREVFEDSHPLMSKVYFVLKMESLFAKVQTHGLELLDLLRSCEGLPVELSSSSLEHCVHKIKQMGCDKPSAIVSKAIKDQVQGMDISKDIRSKIADLLSLRSNQELLIELVALENLKENAEQLEKVEDVEYIEEMIGFVTHMHNCFVEIKQSQSCNPVPIPPDFCCPLSLELMTDPVIVASGQTYERVYIRNWIALGLTVCPKTMQTLAHTNLIPNYTVKALIANWCETHNVKLPGPVKSTSLNQPGYPRSLVQHVVSSSEDSIPGVSENGHKLDNENDRSNETGERSSDLGEPSSLLPPKKESSASSGMDEESPKVSHDANDEPLPQAATTYTSDASGEVVAELQPAIVSPSAAPQRELHEYSPRFGNRSRHQMWRRPSGKMVTETRPELSGVETQVKKLVEDLSSLSLDIVKNATLELRLLARHDKDIRNVIANCGAIPLLINLLRSPDQSIQENSVTALLNLSINDINKATIGNSGAIEPLIYVLETGSSEAKENSAATLFSLSVIEDNKIQIGRSGAIGPLVDLLGNGTPRGKKDAATALFNLSTFHENKSRIVQAGAVKYLIDLMDPATGMVDKAVAVLSNLATIPEGRAGIGQEGGIPTLVEVIELGSARGKENAAAALLQLCTNSSRFCNMVLQEGAIPPLVALSQNGTPRAKEKAQSLISYFRNQRHGNGGRR